MNRRYEDKIRSHVKSKQNGYEPHKMYDPNTGKVTTPKTKSKHSALASKGYGHNRVKNSK
jgi:hypothetical protein